jgi:hypothetical protein
MDLTTDLLVHLMILCLVGATLAVVIMLLGNVATILRALATISAELARLRQQLEERR